MLSFNITSVCWTIKYEVRQITVRFKENILFFFYFYEKDVKLSIKMYTSIHKNTSINNIGLSVILK